MQTYLRCNVAENERLLHALSVKLVVARGGHVSPVEAATQVVRIGAPKLGRLSGVFHESKFTPAKPKTLHTIQ